VSKPKIVKRQQSEATLGEKCESLKSLEEDSGEDEDKKKAEADKIKANKKSEKKKGFFNKIFK